MNIKKITYSAGATVNTGNFNSIRFDWSAEAELQVGDDPEESANKLRDWVQEKIETEIKEATGD